MQRVDVVAARGQEGGSEQPHVEGGEYFVVVRIEVRGGAAVVRRIHVIISSRRAFRQARDGDAKGRGCWERIRWPDAKFEVTGAKCDLRNEQQREKREESRERREKREEKREDRRAQTEARREKREEGREKREERDNHDQSSDQFLFEF